MIKRKAKDKAKELPKLKAGETVWIRDQRGFGLTSTYIVV